LFFLKALALGAKPFTRFFVLKVEIQQSINLPPCWGARDSAKYKSAPVLGG